MIVLLSILVIGWSPPECISLDPLDDCEPAITGDGLGNVWVSWVNSGKLCTRYWNGNQWSEVMLIDTIGVTSPCMDKGPTGNPWIVWNGETVIKTAVYDGSTWVVIPTSFGSAWLPQINGNPLWITWMESTAGGTIFASFYDWGFGWSCPDTVTYILPCYCVKSHAMAADTAANIWVVLRYHGGLYAKSSGDGWQDSMTVVTGEASAFHTMTVDSVGKIWVSFYTGVDIYASYYDGVEWSLSTLVCSTTEYPYRLNSTTDGLGTVWIAWSAGNIPCDIFVSYYTPAQWITSPLDTCPSDDRDVCITTDIQGCVWAAWTSNRDGDYNIYVSHTEAQGVNEITQFSNSECQLQVYPNPFSERVDIRFNIEQPPSDRIKNTESKIYNVSGKLVKKFNRESSMAWDGTDNSGNRLPSGVYFLKFQAGDYSATEKLLLIR